VAYVTADYRLQCWNADAFNSEWLMYVTIAGICFAIFGPGVLLSQWYMLYKNQASLHDDSHPDHEDTSQKFGFLYDSYQSTAWYWEGCDTPGACLMHLNLELTITSNRVLSMHKLLLTGLIIFVKPNSVSQLAAATVINGVFLLMHIRIEPYTVEKDGHLQFWALWSLMSSLFLGILLKADVQVRALLLPVCSLKLRQTHNACVHTGRGPVWRGGGDHVPSHG
jgi:hypothetical protein